MLHWIDETKIKYGAKKHYESKFSLTNFFDTESVLYITNPFVKSIGMFDNMEVSYETSVMKFRRAFALSEQPWSKGFLPE